MRLLTTNQASAEFHVTTVLIHRWTERGLLQPVAPGVYREIDVARTEAKTRRVGRWTELIRLAQEEGREEAA